MNQWTFKPAINEGSNQELLSQQVFLWGFLRLSYRKPSGPGHQRVGSGGASSSPEQQWGRFACRCAYLISFVLTSNSYLKLFLQIRYACRCAYLISFVLTSSSYLMFFLQLRFACQFAVCVRHLVVVSCILLRFWFQVVLGVIRFKLQTKLWLSSNLFNLFWFVLIDLKNTR